MTIQKPIDIAVVDLKKDIINNMNTSRLPLSILNMIIKEISATIGSEFEASLKKTREAYNNQLVTAETVADPLVDFEEGVN